jgi:hypothetical protein
MTILQVSEQDGRAIDHREQTSWWDPFIESIWLEVEVLGVRAGTWTHFDLIVTARTGHDLLPLIDVSKHASCLIWYR